MREFSFSFLPCLEPSTGPPDGDAAAKDEFGFFFAGVAALAVFFFFDMKLSIEALSASKAI